MRWFKEYLAQYGSRNGWELINLLNRGLYHAMQHLG